MILHSALFLHTAHLCLVNLSTPLDGQNGLVLGLDG